MSLAISRHILSVFAPSPRPRVPWGRELVFNLAFELVAMAMGEMLGRCWAVPSEWASSSPIVAVHFVRCLTLCLPKYPSIVCRYHVSVVSLTPETAKSRALWENLIPYTEVQLRIVLYFLYSGEVRRSPDFRRMQDLSVCHSFTSNVKASKTRCTLV